MSETCFCKGLKKNEAIKSRKPLIWHTTTSFIQLIMDYSLFPLYKAFLLIFLDFLSFICYRTLLLVLYLNPGQSGHHRSKGVPMIQRIRRTSSNQTMLSKTPSEGNYRGFGSVAGETLDEFHDRMYEIEVALDKHPAI